MIEYAMRMFHISAQHAETLVLIVRKTIHFTFYGLLGWTGFRFAVASGADKRKAIFCGLLMALFFASFDESRQTFFPNRTGSAYDVLLDFVGALTFISLSSRSFGSNKAPVEIVE